MEVSTTATVAAVADVTPVRRARWLAGVALLSLAAIWGATFFMVKDATSSFPVLAFLVVRFAIAALALLPLALTAPRRANPPRGAWRWGVGAGLLFASGYVFQTFALRLIDSGRAGFLTGLYVIMVPFLALVLLRYSLSVRVLLGAVLALIGMALLGYAPGSDLVGDVLALLCALGFALHILVLEKMPRDADWRTMALLQSVVVMGVSAMLLPLLASAHGCDSALCLALEPFADPLPTSIPPIVWAVAAFTGLLATAFGLSVQVWAQRILPPSEAALIFALESPFSVVFGIVFRNEALTLVGLLGCVLIFAGTLVTTIRSSGAAIREP